MFKCSVCFQKDFTVFEDVFVNQTKHARVVCNSCGHYKFMDQKYLIYAEKVIPNAEQRKLLRKELKKKRKAHRRLSINL